MNDKDLIDLIEAMSTKEIRTLVREFKKDSGEKYDYCDEDWEVLLYLHQLRLRERDRWREEQAGL